VTIALSCADKYRFWMLGSRLERLMRPWNRRLSLLGCQVAYFIVCRGFLLTYGVVSAGHSLASCSMRSMDAFCTEQSKHLERREIVLLSDSYSSGVIVHVTPFRAGGWENGNERALDEFRYENAVLKS